MKKMHISYIFTFVTFADDESLVYKDEFGSSHMWDKTQ